MTIYTRNGDKGTSNLITGKIAKKSDMIFHVLGTFDEFNASLGFLHISKFVELKKIVYKIQTDIFEISSFLAGKPVTKQNILYFDNRVKELETEIDKYEKQNKPLKNFIFPGGTNESARLHLCRVIARRAERIFVQYIVSFKVKNLDMVERYLNRLSDYLFVLARFYNDRGKKDIVWKH
jgi:cob(I)alamin adenosyltransferase